MEGRGKVSSIKLSAEVSLSSKVIGKRISQGGKNL